MRFPWDKPPADPQRPVETDLEAELVQASLAADDAASALAVALERRRRAAVALAGQTALAHKGPLNAIVTAYSVVAACWFHEHGRPLAKHIGLDHVSVRARTSFWHQARRAIATSAAGRSPSPDTAPGGLPGLELEHT